MSKRWSNLLQSDAESGAQCCVQFTISSTGQICACSIEVAFKTSTTKNLFGKCCYLYISSFSEVANRDDDSTKLAIGLITPFSIKRDVSHYMAMYGLPASGDSESPVSKVAPDRSKIFSAFTDALSFKMEAGLPDGAANVVEVNDSGFIGEAAGCMGIGLGSSGDEGDAD
nr:hypothetical protein CFP56_74217 [Quercus suber]